MRIDMLFSYLRVFAKRYIAKRGTKPLSNILSYSINLTLILQ